MADDLEMSAAQTEVYNRIVSGRRGKIVGPLRAVLHSPELADHWQALGSYLRFDSHLPAELSELAIICTGRYWNSQIEWLIHARIAKKAGLPDEIIEAIREARAPAFEDSRQAAVYAFTRELLEFGFVSDATYAAIYDAFDTVPTVELTAIVGYYSMVAMTLNAHKVPIPESETGVRLSLPDGDMPAPTRLPAATLFSDQE